ncbi:hypothetical protein NT90_11410 [Acinetobacter baumannii]|uniref:putative phage abortive infection protein n=1 Tax=Acinetobacter seifertii TaxID=1530123 RepID=UPI000574A533|nr:putative phage abortive infection protein [Acinetobacter seifertii]KHO15228.1 hypothetical protein NT90_11410 [Acinetobacter baumannii]
MNLTGLQKKLIWGVGILSIICLWIAFPLIFKTLIDAYKLPEDFKDFGPFGDIYGSLNTLISSIALCAVAYSTWLQITSLKETRESTIKQQNLTQAIHDEQIKESRNAIFTNRFYSLLSYKEEILKSLCVTYEGKAYQGREIFDLYFYYIDKLFSNEWKGRIYFHKNVLLSEIYKCDKLVNDGKEFNDWYVYFLQTVNIINLIKNSNIDKGEKEFFYNILRSSMSMHEQITLFWVAPVTPQVYEFLRETSIFNLFFNKNLIPFGKQFYDETFFNNKSWGDVFNKDPT